MHIVRMRKWVCPAARKGAGLIDACAIDKERRADFIYSAGNFHGVSVCALLRRRNTSQEHTYERTRGALVLFALCLPLFKKSFVCRSVRARVCQRSAIAEFADRR